MAATCGKLLVIEIDANEDDTFSAVAGLRSKTFSINHETVDVTDADSAGSWRELLASCGVKSVSFSGDGIFKDNTTDDELRASIMAGSLLPYQVTVPGFGTFAMTAMVTSLEFTGGYNEALEFSASFESSGEVTFTAA
jgi:TP901-1 family phage major tail protein